MMIHSDAMSHMDHFEFIGNLILLIVGGNDTTRNSMTALAYGLDRFPDERAKLEADPSLIPNTTQEIIRWQTPLAHMRRTATRDTELMGQTIREGDKLALWYISANRDESVFGPDADKIVVDRPNATPAPRLRPRHPPLRGRAAGRVADRHPDGGNGEAADAGERGRRTTRVAACFVHGYRQLPVEISRY